MSKARILVADDETILGNTLKKILSELGYAVALCNRGEEFFQHLEEQKPDLVLLDIRLPGMDGLNAQAVLAERSIQMPIIFLTGHGEVQMSVRAMKAGAYDFLQKPVSADTLLARVYAALRLDQRRVQERAEVTEARERLARLTTREQEIFGHLLQGASSKEIAKQLGLSPRTVDIHRKNILIKCRASSVLELSELQRRGST